MATSPETYLTARQHADGLAREFYKDSWREYRNKPFDRLFPAIWLNQFKDEVACSLIFSPGDVRQHKGGFRPAPGRSPIRELLWRVLGKGTYWVPDAVKNARENERLWQEMAALSWDDYDPPWRRNIIEQVVILGSAFERWESDYRVPENTRAAFWFGNASKQSDVEQTETQPVLRIATKQDQQTYFKLMIAKEAVENLRERYPSWSAEHIAATLSKDPDIGYSLETLRKIVRGTYLALKRLGIPR